MDRSGGVHSGLSLVLSGHDKVWSKCAVLVDIFYGSTQKYIYHYNSNKNTAEFSFDISSNGGPIYLMKISSKTHRFTVKAIVSSAAVES